MSGTHRHIGIAVAAALLVGGGGGVADEVVPSPTAARVLALAEAGRPCEAFHVAASRAAELADGALIDALRERCRPSDAPSLRVLVRGGAWSVEEPDGERLTAVNDFYLDRFEVTVGDLHRCLRAGVCDPARVLDYAANSDCNLGAPNREHHPVNCVDWYSASVYCAFGGGRLPTESELEWVASQGGRLRFPWGWPAATCERANHRHGLSVGCGLGSTRPVGSHPDGASPAGAEDLIGNVSEWAADGFQDHLPAGRYIDPVFEGDSSRHAARGGSWRDFGSLLGSHLRVGYWASSQSPEVGFRCAYDGDTPPAPAQRRSRAAASALADDTVRVSSGSFLRGSPPGTGDIDEAPQRSIRLGGFRMSRTEVTVSQFRDCVIDGGCRGLELRRYGENAAECNYGAVGRGGHPVNCISWASAQEFCHWAGGRLPTEAEWEYAAAGIDSRSYPWGNEPVDCSLASFNPDGRLQSAGCGYGGTMPVGLFTAGASAFQALDMAGNVQEWVADWYDGDSYMLAPETDPRGPLAGSSRVVRGGSYADSGNDLRCENRSFLEPTAMPSVVGFRCAWPLDD